MESNRILKQYLEEPLRAWFGSRPEWQGNPVSLVFQETRKEFEGELTLVLFGPSKQAGLSPAALAGMLQPFLESLQLPDGAMLIRSVHGVGGFLNLGLSYEYWRQRWSRGYQVLPLPQPEQGRTPSESTVAQTIVLEYSSPNTNKPLHLGHVRNNLLGDAMYRILSAVGHKVVRVQVINDRGIHICKSMVAWSRFGKGQSPQDAGIKGDHWVGHFYVLFEKAFQEEVQQLMGAGQSREEAEKSAPILEEARTMLQQWEQGNSEVVSLWQTMNQWVYEGFEQTYSRLGIGFDRNYYESKTYLLGKSLVLKGLDHGLFRRDDTGAVWADLQEEGLDSKVLLRGDGTSVYITQDLGTAEQRQEDWAFDRMIYTVANEQDYHFKVLFALLRKLGFPWAAWCQHLSYGMVDLPHGRMKSREGTVVDADDLMDEVEAMATAKLEQSEKLSDQSRAELEQLAREIGLAALKFYILKVDPTKRMVYNPEEAIDLQGHTGPFVQYAHARICSVLAKAEKVCKGWEVKDPWSLDAGRALHEEELQLLRTFSDFSEQVHQAASRNNPSLVADFAYRLATAFNRFYHECPVLQEASEETRGFRLALCLQTRDLLALSLDLLGITAPLRM